jgi:transcriptional regulator with XRE-family HTH domain
VTQKELGEKLRRRREYLGFTQDEVADYMGMHRPSVTEIEAGRRKVGALELEKLAALYQTQVAFFLTQETAPVSEAQAAVLKELDGEDALAVLEFSEFLHWRKRRGE